MNGEPDATNLQQMPAAAIFGATDCQIGKSRVGAKIVTKMTRKKFDSFVKNLSTESSKTKNLSKKSASIESKATREKVVMKKSYRLIALKF